MLTDITDNYPYLEHLECQYFDICKHYNPDRCFYDNPCKAKLVVDNNIGIDMRSIFRKGIERYVVLGNLKTQVELLRKEEQDRENEKP